jgi:hypothetical protein
VLASTTIHAIDPELNSLTYSLDSAPAGASIHPTTGVFQWTPTEAQSPGNYTIIVRVTDNGEPSRSSLVDFEVSVSEENQAPQWPTLANRSISEGVAFQTIFTAADPELGAIDYDLMGVVPAGASIHPTTGMFSWTPTEAQGPGVYTITLRASDRGSPVLSSTTSLIFTILETNATPILVEIANRSVSIGQTLAFLASASDTDAPVNALTYSLDGGAPAGASINPLTGLFLWTPTVDQVGLHTINVRVTDDGSPSRSDTTSFTVTVEESTGNPPTISTLTDRTIFEDQQLAPVDFTIGDQETSAADLIVTASSSDSSLVPAANITLSGTGASRTISVQPLPDRNGVVTITVTVDDGEQTTQESFQLTVTAVNDPPTFTLSGNPPAIVANASLRTVNDFATDISAGPADESTQTLDFILEVVSTTRNLAFAVAPDIDPMTGQLTYQPLANTFGNATISVRLVDNGLDGDPHESSSQPVTFVLAVGADKWQNYANSLDVNGDTQVVPLDALLVINELNQRTLTSAIGQLPALSPDFQPPPYFDVTGDGFVLPIDALIIINYLNSLAGGEGELALAAEPTPAEAMASPAVNPARGSVESAYTSGPESTASEEVDVVWEGVCATKVDELRELAAVFTGRHRLRRASGVGVELGNDWALTEALEAWDDLLDVLAADSSKSAKATNS